MKPQLQSVSSNECGQKPLSSFFSLVSRYVDKGSFCNKASTYAGQRKRKTRRHKALMQTPIGIRTQGVLQRGKKKYASQTTRPFQIAMEMRCDRLFEITIEIRNYSVMSCFLKCKELHSYSPLRPRKISLPYTRWRKHFTPDCCYTTLAKLILLHPV